MNLIRVKKIVIERAVDFVTILEEDFPRLTLFSRALSRVLIGYRYWLGQFWTQRAKCNMQNIACCVLS